MTKPKLWLDLESFSTVPIEHGTHAYVEHAEILLFAYAIGDAPAKVWDCTAHSVGRLPRDLTTALLDPDVLVTAHNSHFDRTLLNHILPGLCPPLHRWRDTMAQALSHSLPASLADLCAVLKVPVDKAKAKDGRQLLLLFCKPRPKGSGIARATWQTHPEEWARFVDYGRLDVEAMREVARLMPSWNWQAKDIDLWHLDQTINDRGILMDLDLAKGAVRAVAGAQAALAKRTSDITLGAVQSATQRDALLQHIGSVWGVPLPDLQKSTLKRRAEDPDLPPEVRELFDIRLQAGSSGASKYKALLNGVSRCGRCTPASCCRCCGSRFRDYRGWWLSPGICCRSRCWSRSRSRSRSRCRGRLILWCGILRPALSLTPTLTGSCSRRGLRPGIGCRCGTL